MLFARQTVRSAKSWLAARWRSIVPQPLRGKQGYLRAAVIETTLKTQSGGYMINRPEPSFDNSTDTDDSTSPTYVKPTQRPMPITSPEISKLCETLRSRESDFRSSIRCQHCHATICFGVEMIDWPYGEYSVFFSGVPAYHCPVCGNTYFAEDDLTDMVDTIDSFASGTDLELPGGAARPDTFIPLTSRK